MGKKAISQAITRAGGAIFLLSLLVIVTYSNTFHASWHLDDNTVILDNQNLHVSTLSFDDLSRCIHLPFTDPSNPKPGLSGLYRPVAMLTLAFNWFLGGADVFGYHLVNISIHCVTASLLFFTIINLLSAPNMNGRYKGSEHFIALLATVLWALHPIQTQAVTYIVQRMTSLAALFYLSGIFLFIKARNVRTPGKRNLAYGVCFICFLLAVGSKENAATLPAALLLIEVIFFTNPKFWKQTKAKWIAFGAFIGLVTFFALLLFLWQKNPIFIITDSYRVRPFTMIERLLTEFRIIIYYLYQLVSPVPQQFSIMHDFEVSKSLLNPITTIASLSAICGLITVAFYTLRTKPLLSFSILFFFLGHSIESTILPLELVFEHRNYLPSFFLFLPVASAMKNLIDTYRKKGRLLYFLLLAFTPTLIAGVALGCYTRNLAWATEKSLWQDAMKKAPALARPYQNFALALEREGKLNIALGLYKKALTLKDPDPVLSRFISLANIGNIYKKFKLYDHAVIFLTKAVKTEKGPYMYRARYNLVLCLLNVNKYDEALTNLETLLAKIKNSGRFLSTKGFLLFLEGKKELALHSLRMALKQNPSDREALVNLAMVFCSQAFYKRAEWFLHRARERYPDNIVIYFALLQNAVQMNDHERINRFLDQLISRFSFAEIKSYLAERAMGYRYINSTLVPLDDQIFLPYITDMLRQLNLYES